MSYGGSTMFLDTTDRVRVEDLLRGIIVLSGNDACAVIAEALSPDGTEAGFARFMTQRGRKMGLTNSTFMNSNGWPAPGHRMSVRDLAVLAERLIEDFPGFYPMFAETEFTSTDGRRQHPQPQPASRLRDRRRRAQDRSYRGRGLRAGGLGQAGRPAGDLRDFRAQQGARAAREEAEAIINWSFRQFVEKRVLRAGAEVARADVWMGNMPSVGLTAAEDVTTLLPVLASDGSRPEVVHSGPVRAPVSRGEQLAELVLSPEGLPEMRVPLVASRDVDKGGFMARLKAVSAASGPPAAGTRGGALSVSARCFVSFEGIDGSGKSTQARLLAEHLRGAGRDVVLTREPGGSPGAEEIRRLLLEGDPDRWSAETEILLFTAARRDHLERTIRPALEAGKLVICDRFADSTRVYQALRARLRTVVDELHRLMIGQEPDLTLLIDMDPETGLRARSGAQGRGTVRILRRRASGADACRVSRAGGRISRPYPWCVDGARPVDEVAAEIRAIVTERLA